MKINDHISVSDYNNGPFVIIVIDTQRKDGLFPIVISAAEDKGGKPFETQDEAIAWIETNYAHRATPYLDCTFTIVPMWSRADFNAFCSWEE